MGARDGRADRTTLAAPAWTWASVVVLAGLQLVLAALYLGTEAGPGRWAGWLFLAAGCGLLVQAWWQGSERIHLTPEAVVAVRGLRRRRIAWRDVQRIELVQRAGRADAVQIRPRGADPVTALVRRSWLVRRDDSIERNLRQLERYWHARADVPAPRDPH